MPALGFEPLTFGFAHLARSLVVASAMGGLAEVTETTAVVTSYITQSVYIHIE